VAFPYKTILCPVDFDENSLDALEVPPPAALYEDQEKDAQAKLADIAKQKLGELKHEARVYTGDVIATILAALLPRCRAISTAFSSPILIRSRHPTLVSKNMPIALRGAFTLKRGTSGASGSAVFRQYIGTIITGFSRPRSKSSCSCISRSRSC